MIDLNSIIFNESISKQDVFSIIAPLDIFKKYIDKNIELSIRINSPLRQDSIPSFAIFYASNARTIMYKDFATGDSGDAIEFVKKMYGLNYKEAIDKLFIDFNISPFNTVISHQKTFSTHQKIYSTKQVYIGIKKREWLNRDKKYWSSYGVTIETLERFNVFPIQYIFLNNYCLKAEEYSYAYKEIKDNEVSYKIYQPFSIKTKWLNNTNFTVHQGYKQLPETGNLLIITKSLKDVMSLWDTCKIPSIGVQAESVIIKESVMREYKNRFKHVLLLFDNDEPGIKFSSKFESECKISSIFMPKKLGKDFSDVCKAVGQDKIKLIIQKIICGKLGKDLFV